MLDSRVCTHPAPLPVPASAVGGMSLLGPEYPFLERLDGGGCFGLGLGAVPGFPPLPSALWRPGTLWGSPPPPPPPPPPLLPPPLPPLCPERCHVPALVGTGVTHLLEFVDSPRLWYPWYCKGLDNGYDVGGGKELPTRSLKADRLKERQDLSQALHMDKDHAASIQARKTATISTQTQYSSFKGEAPPYPGPPPGPPPSYFAPHGDNYPPVHQGLRPPPPLPPPPHASTLPPSSPPASSHLVDLSRPTQGDSSDVQNAPLNLSLSNSSSGVSPSLAAPRQPPRPSVITCMSSSSSSSSREGSPRVQQNGHGGPSGRGSPGACSPPVSDPAIEEHFRRSLGRSYEDSIPKTAPATTASTDLASVSVTESVDDHFAKALGDSTWKAIKSQNDPTLDVFTGSVDDHFAKALGATTWRRIKAETEHSESISSNGSSSSYGPSTAATTSPPASSLSATVAS